MFISVLSIVPQAQFDSFILKFGECVYCLLYTLSVQHHIHMFLTAHPRDAGAGPGERWRCGGRGGGGERHLALLSYLFYQISPVRLTLRCIKKNVLWPKKLQKQELRHGVSGEGLPRQTGFSQTGDPENDVGRPGEIHGAAGDRLRSLRHSLVSLPGEEAHDFGYIDEEFISGTLYFEQQNSVQ